MPFHLINKLCGKFETINKIFCIIFWVFSCLNESIGRKFDIFKREFHEKSLQYRKTLFNEDSTGSIKQLIPIRLNAYSNDLMDLIRTHLVLYHEILMSRLM